MLTQSEILMIVNDYIGGTDGYLASFSYAKLQEFYPYYCELELNDISFSAYNGTTRDKFLTILENSDSPTQSKILKGVLEKCPVKSFSEEVRQEKQKLANKIGDLIERLEKGQSVAFEQLTITNETVERAIENTKTLIKNNDAISGVDRIHTALHGYLKEVCKQAKITLTGHC